MVNSTNSHCNAFQAVQGFFLESVNAPEHIIDVLAHGGWCQGASETGNVSCPSAHGALTDLQDRCSRGQVPAECLEQKMLYAYVMVCTQGDFTLSRK